MAELRASAGMLHAIRRAQAGFISGKNPKESFEVLLDTVLSVTNSEYGFIGEVLYDQSKPYLKTHSITNIAWDEATRNFYETGAPEGLVFRNLDTLFGHVMTSREPVIANDPTHDPRRGGLPDGHPEMRAFLGLPFFHRGKLVGMVGIANRPRGYDQALCEQLDPLLGTCANLIDAWGNQKLRAQAEDDRRAAEERLRQSTNREEDLSRRLSLAVDSGQIGIWDFDIRRQMLTWDKRMHQLYDVSVSSGTDMYAVWMLRLHPEDRARARTEFHEAIASCSSLDTEYRAVVEDGSVRHIKVFANAVVDAAGATTRMLGVSYDVSKQRQVEADLLESKKSAEAANEAKSRFLTTMSHEIRTPLNGILGMAQLLRLPGLAAEELDEYSAAILKSGRVLLTLLSDILDLSRVEAGRLSVARGPYDPRQVVEDTMAVFESLGHAKELKIEARLGALRASRYVGDSDRLQQILSNLVSNAIKFTDAGSVTVELREVEPIAGNAQLEFSVSDTGIGIEEGHMDLLFDSFSQVDNSDSRRFGGSGLGLSIVRSLVELMHGEVGVNSIPGKGSRFWVRVPGGVQAKSLDGDEEEFSLKEKSFDVLIVEDDEVNCQVIEAALAKLGYSSQTASNGRMAVDLVTTGGARPRIVLMDCQMPLVDGFDATRELRHWEESGSRARLPIVALTGDAFAKNRQHCLDSGMDDFIAKPLDLETLRDVIEAHARPKNEEAAG